MKPRMLWVVLAIAAGTGCEKKNAQQPAPGSAASTAGDGGAAAAPAAAAPAPVPPMPKVADTTPLWALAPADATLGFVVGDGAGARVLTTWAGSVKKLAGKPFAKKSLEQLEKMKSEIGFDPFDENAYKAKGIDLTKGLAVFATADLDKPGLLVVPVGDREAWRKTIKATVEKAGDRDLDKSGQVVCTTVGDRYLCAASVEAIDAATKPHEAPLAAAVKALPADRRGDAEFYVDAAKTPKAKEALGQLRQLGEFATLGAALRVDAGQASLVGWGQGTMGPLGQMLASAPPPADLAGMTANATSVFRIKLDPKLLAATGQPATVPGPNGEQIALADLLTGDIQIVTAGKGILAGAILVKVTDPAKVKPLVAGVCGEIKKGGSLPTSAVVVKDDGCSGEVSLASIKDSIGVELPPFKFNFSLAGNVFVVALGDLDPAALKGSVVDEASGPETKEILAGAQTAVLYTRDMDIDVSALPKELIDKINAVPDLADGIHMMNWSASQAYDLGAALNVSSTGFKIVFHGTTFASDPPEARAALEAAFDKRAAGDRAGYVAALADIEKNHPSSLAARRAKLERIGTPIVGPLLGVAVGAGAAAAYFVSSAAGGTPAAPHGGGFGQPGAVPPAAPPDGK